jgi:type II secretory pathway pseudopilin PulG
MKTIIRLLVSLVVCGLLYVLVVPELAKSGWKAKLINSLNDWHSAGSPRGDALKQWYKTYNLNNRNIQIEECDDALGNKRVVFWLNIGLKKRIGRSDDYCDLYEKEN